MHKLCFALFALVLLAGCGTSEPPRTEQAAAPETGEPVAASQPAQTAVPPSPDQACSVLDGLPLAFEENRGQAEVPCRYLSRGPDYTVFLSAEEVALVLRGEDEVHRLAIRIDGADPAARFEALEKLPGVVNYYVGNDPEDWQEQVPTFGRVAVRDVRPGVDVVYYGTGRRLEYDLVVSPGTDPSDIVLGFEGARNLEIDDGGGLVIGLSQGIVKASTVDIVRNSAEIMPYVVLLIVLLIRPEGLFGQKRIERI